MAISDTAPLSSSEHQLQLRRAVIASTIGTAIEWYDFFLYSTVTGLVFAKLFFPHSDPWVGTLEAFAIYAVGFIARPIGAAIFGHYGDRIGRKSTLIATLLLMGLATAAVAFVPTYDQHRHLGRGHSHRAALHPGRRRRRRMGRLGAAVDGMGAQRSLARFRRIMAAVRRALRVVPRQPRRARLQPDVRRSIPDLGLAHPVRAEPRAGRGRPLHPARHHGNAGIHQTAGRTQDRPHADADRDPATSEGNPAFGIRPDGRAGAVLHLHGLRVLLRHRHAARVAQLPALRGAGGLGIVVRLDPACSATCPISSGARTCT